MRQIKALGLAVVLVMGLCSNGWAAGKGDTFENDLLKLIFNATAIANIADNAASAPLTNLYVALHTADPTDAGAQNASEAAYTGYARVSVARTSGGWTVSGNSVSPVANIDFGECTASCGSTSRIGRSGWRPPGRRSSCMPGPCLRPSPCPSGRFRA